MVDYLKSLKIDDPLTMSMTPEPVGGIKHKAMGFNETRMKIPSLQAGAGAFTRNEIAEYREQGERKAIKIFLKEQALAKALAEPLLEREDGKRRLKEGLMKQMTRKALETGMLRDVEAIVRTIGTMASKEQATAEVLKRYEGIEPELVRESYGMIEARSHDAETRGMPLGRLEHRQTFTPISEITPYADVMIEPTTRRAEDDDEMIQRLIRPRGEREMKFAEDKPSAFSTTADPEGTVGTREEFEENMIKRILGTKSSTPPEAEEGGKGIETAIFSALKRELPPILEKDIVSKLSKKQKYSLRKAYDKARVSLPHSLERQNKGNINPKKP